MDCLDHMLRSYKGMGFYIPSGLGGGFVEGGSRCCSGLGGGGRLEGGRGCGLDCWCPGLA